MSLLSFFGDSVVSGTLSLLGRFLELDCVDLKIHKNYDLNSRQDLVTKGSRRHETLVDVFIKFCVKDRTGLSDRLNLKDTEIVSSTYYKGRAFRLVATGRRVFEVSENEKTLF